jgi:hypothetical protein
MRAAAPISHQSVLNASLCSKWRGREFPTSFSGVAQPSRRRRRRSASGISDCCSARFNRLVAVEAQRESSSSPLRFHVGLSLVAVVLVAREYECFALIITYFAYSFLCAFQPTTHQIVRSPSARRPCPCAMRTAECVGSRPHWNSGPNRPRCGPITLSQSGQCLWLDNPTPPGPLGGHWQARACSASAAWLPRPPSTLRGGLPEPARAKARSKTSAE